MDDFLKPFLRKMCIALLILGVHLIGALEAARYHVFNNKPRVGSESACLVTVSAPLFLGTNVKLPILGKFALCSWQLYSRNNAFGASGTS